MPRSPRLSELNWPAVPVRPVALVPVGSTEQHGPHLPFDVDTRIAVAVCDAVAAATAEAAVVVTPPVAFGSSGEHQGFPGTVSIGTPVLTAVLIELGRSIGEWAGRIHFVNGHGGNLDALDAALRTLAAEGRAVSWSPCRHGDAHAGRAETSLLLHLDPGAVDAAAIAPGNTTALAELLPAMRAGGVGAVSPSGVLGDPTGATAAEGERILAAMAAAVAAELAVASRGPGADAATGAARTAGA